MMAVSLRLEDAGYAVGSRVLELLCNREKVRFVFCKMMSETCCLNDWKSQRFLFFPIFQGNRRETRLLGILSFVHSTVWKVLFGKVSEWWFFKLTSCYRIDSFYGHAIGCWFTWKRNRTWRWVHDQWKRASRQQVYIPPALSIKHSKIKGSDEKCESVGSFRFQKTWEHSTAERLWPA